MQLCLKVSRHVTGALFAVSAVLIALATALATINTVARFFTGGFTWSDQLCITAIDLWVKGERAQRILSYIRGIITSAAMLVLGYYGVDVMLKAFKRHQVTYVLQLPRGGLYAIVLVCIFVAVAAWVVLMLCKKGEFDDA